VLIHAAAGGVGHLAVQFAKHLGAHVVGTASKAKHDWQHSIGADELIDYHSTAVEDATGDLDLVVDLIGSETTLGQSIKVLKPDGHALGEIAKLVENGEVRVEVEQVFPLAEAAEAHRRMASGRTQGKLALDILQA
jgi:NADPH:quinone reductase-like Zn-dependent oxidoreductase